MLTSYLKIPGLLVIESIVARSPPQTVGKGNNHSSDLEATAAEILAVQSKVQGLFKPNIGDKVQLWQMLSRFFGSLGLRFADIGWLVGAFQMSYHDVQIWCALANFQSHQVSPDLSRSLIIPAAPPYYVEFLDAIAGLLHYWSLYSATQFRFNDARKANKEAIRIQSKLCLHDPANKEFASALSRTQRHFSSF